MNASALLNIIGRPQSKGVVIVENQSVHDIINLIRYKHEKHAADYDKIAKYFWTGTIEGTARKLFDFCKSNIRYNVESEENQTVSSPAKILEKKRGDCKHYATFIAGVLDSLSRDGKNINWVYRFASYNPFDDSPGHVFVVIKQKGRPEIWIDPVLDEFNIHKSFQYAIDKKYKAVAMSGIGAYNSIGRLGVPYRSALGLSALSPADCVRSSGNMIGAGSTAQTGQLIMKVAPALAVVPVVGWIAGAGAEIVGGLISAFGSKWSQSPDVRWLIQLYQFYVQGNAAVTSDNKTDERLTQTAQAYFSVVLGVPIGGRKDLNILQSGDGNTNSPSGVSAQTRANNYIAWKGLQGQIDPNAVLEAAQIAGQLQFNNKPGSWAGLTAAPSVIDYTKQQAGANLPAGSNIQTAGLFSGLPSWVLWGLGITAVFFIFNQPKHKTKRA